MDSKMIEEVKKILQDHHRDIAFWYNEPLKQADRDMTYFARLICQLFPKSADNPDGYGRKGWIEVTFKLAEIAKVGEPKPLPKVTFYNERTRAIQEVKGVWEDKTFCFDIPATLEKGQYLVTCQLEPKPDESRLLSPEEIEKLWGNQNFKYLMSHIKDFISQVAKAQLAKDQRFEAILLDEFKELLIKTEAECQARIEKILENITEDFVEMVGNYYARGGESRDKIFELWESVKRHALKAREGVK